MSDDGPTGPGWEGPTDPVSAWLALALEEAPPAGDAPAAVIGRAPASPPLLFAGGRLAAGPAAALVDTVGGMTCGLALQPDWVVTSTLTLLVAPAPWPDGGTLVARGRLLHAGRRSAASQVLLGSPEAPRAGAVALVGSARVRVPTLAGAVPPGNRPRPFRRPAPAPELGRPLAALADLATSQERSEPVRVELADALRNPLGILHGGLTAVLADATARRFAGPSWTVRRLSIRYLVPATTGPVRARARVRPAGGGALTAQVEVVDEGNGGRQVATAQVTLAEPRSEP
jgi:uncharacterized protein (TIGR00369 family)